MIQTAATALDWLGIVAFTVTGALVASRKQMDVVGFVVLGTVTGIVVASLSSMSCCLSTYQWLDRKPAAADPIAPGWPVYCGN